MAVVYPWLTTPRPQLQAPTIIDLVDAVVRASNNLLIYELACKKDGRPNLSEWSWSALAEADYQINSVQDAIYEKVRGTNVYGEPVEE